VRNGVTEKYRIAVPAGDVAGIGPEIVAKALSDPIVENCADVIVIGDRNIMEQAVRIVQAPLTVKCIADPDEGDYSKGVLNLINLNNIDMSRFEFGKVNPMCGKAAFEYIKKAIELAMDGQVEAVATTPINKEALRAAGIPYIGHTEIFGALTHTEDPLTLFETNGLRVFFLTRHVSLRQMLDLITKDRIIDYVKRCMEVLCKLGVEEGTMAVAGLNPHCGEHGLFGTEEVDIIEPAVHELQQMGYQVAGPIGADSVFHQAALGKYNSVLSLYHDQGHIATKTLDFDRTISITGGMPILRTSVDHGTAFDIAGTGKAGSVSMVEAIRLAAKYAPNFKRR
jgi:4-hydroxythreonine-4-phosphate dehydrogenase